MEAREARLQANLIEGPIARTLMQLTSPMVWGLLAMISLNLVDTFFIAQLGEEPLAAMSFSMPIIMIVISILLGQSVGTTSVIARAIGRKDTPAAKAAATGSLLFSGMLLLVASCIGILSVDPLFRLFAVSNSVLDYIRSYMTVWYLGLPLFGLAMVGNAALTAAGNVQLPACIMVCAGVLNLALDPLLIFGLFGFPRLEMEGAAWATVAAYTVALLISMWGVAVQIKLVDLSGTALFPIAGKISVKRKTVDGGDWDNEEQSLFGQNLADDRKLTEKQDKASASGHALWTAWKEILEVSIPAAGSQMIVPITGALTVWLLADFGPEVVGAYGVVARMEAFVLVAVIGLSQCIGPFVGQNWGAKHYRRVQEGVDFGYKFSLAWGVFIAAALGLGGGLIGRLFTENPVTAKTVSEYFHLVPISYGAVGCIFVTGAYFNAIGKPLCVAAIALLRYFVLYIPLAIYIKHLYGPRGIFVVISGVNLMMGVIACLWVRLEAQNLKKLEGGL